jgi:uncharacterized protein
MGEGRKSNPFLRSRITTEMFGKRQPQQATTGRFEIEQNGLVGYLDYTVAGHVIVLSHTEVPENLRGRGLAAELAKSALDWARDHHMRVDVVCPYVAEYLQHHREYDDLLMH